MDKGRKEQIFTYLKSRKNAFIRIGIFLFLAFIFRCIGEKYRVTFFYTTRFLYPVSVILAICQLGCLLPKWVFVKTRVGRLLKKAGIPLQKLWNFGKRGLERIRERFLPGDRSGKKESRQKKAYRDESFYADGSGLFTKRRKHLRWRDMKTNNEKIRYLYMKYVVGRVKAGQPFQYSLTPAELQKLWKAEDKEIVSAYIQARYGVEELPEELVERLKKE